MLAAALAVLSARTVRLSMLSQVVGPHEALVADGAGEPLLPRVCSQVPLQLVGPGEPLPAEQPVAHEGSLSRVPSQVSFQVRGLAVHFTAARDVAVVNVLFLEVSRGRAEPLRLLAVGTVTGGPPGVPPLRPRRSHPGHGRR